MHILGQAPDLECGGRIDDLQMHSCLKMLGQQAKFGHKDCQVNQITLFFLEGNI